jgi:deoxyribonuclease-4
MVDVVDRIKAITGRIDLVHANGSRDGFDSGRDRHANFGSGELDAETVAAVVRAAGCPAVCETPGGVEEHVADIGFLRARV